MASKDSVTLSIEVDPETGRRLETVVARTGRSLRDLVHEALQEILEETEDRDLAVERLRRPQKRWTLEELERGLTVQVARPAD